MSICTASHPADNWSKYDDHMFQIEQEISNNYCITNIDISSVIDPLSTSVPIHFFCNKSPTRSIEKIRKSIYRLFEPVVGRKRAVPGVGLRMDIIEPSYTGILSGDSVIVLVLLKSVCSQRNDVASRLSHTLNIL